MGNPLVGPLSGHTNWVNSIMFSGNGAHIASGSFDRTVRVWDAMSGRLILGPLMGYMDLSDFIAFSPDSKRIVLLLGFRDVCVWNGDMGVLMAGPSLQHTEGALAVVFTPTNSHSAVSPYEKWIAGFARDKFEMVHVWDLKTGQVVASLEGHTTHTMSITFLSNSRRVLTA